MRRAFVLGLAGLLLASEAAAQNWMHWPLDRGTASRAHLTQGFYGDYIAYCGSRGGCGTHNGYDIIVGVGTPVYAVAPGVVDAINPSDVRTADYGNAGLWVRVRHDSSSVPGLGATYFVSYLHLSRIDVAVGASVTTTTRLGLSGNTGGVGPHLHLHTATVTNYCGAPVDPGCPTPAYVRGSVVPSDFVDAPGCQSQCRGVTIQWIEPAAYGNEAYARPLGPACGALDYRGTCDGETLHWCESSVAMEAECLGRGGVCAWQSDEVGFNCLRCDPALNRPLLPGPRCEGSRFLRCDGTTPVAEDCAATGRTCTPDGCQSPTPPDAGVSIDVGNDFIDVPIDVGNDLGGFDAGVRDAGTVDAWTVVDANGGLDGGLGGALSGDCGCRVGTKPAQARWSWAVLAAVWWATRRRGAR